MIRVLVGGFHSTMSRRYLAILQQWIGEEKVPVGSVANLNNYLNGDRIIALGTARSSGFKRLLTKPDSEESSFATEHAKYLLLPPVFLPR